MTRVRAGTLPALAAAPIAFFAAANYLTVIFAQQRDLTHMPIELGVWFIAGYAIAGGALAAISAVLPGGRAYVLAAAAGMILFIGMIGTVSSLAFTFGMPLLAATVLVSVAAARARWIEGTSKAAAFATALLMYVVGVGGYIATIVLPR